MTFARTSADPAQSGLLAYLPSMSWIQKNWAAMSPWNWTFVSSGGQKAVGVYFAALIPGLALYARDRKTLLLIGFCLVYYLVLVRFLHSNPRYGLVLLAYSSVLCGFVAESLSRSRVRAFSAAFQAVFAVTLGLNILWAVALARPATRVAIGSESREHFLVNREPNYRVFRYVNENLPETAVSCCRALSRGTTVSVHTFGTTRIRLLSTTKIMVQKSRS